MLLAPYMPLANLRSVDTKTPVATAERRQTGLLRQLLLTVDHNRLTLRAAPPQPHLPTQAHRSDSDASRRRHVLLVPEDRGHRPEEVWPRQEAGLRPPAPERRRRRDVWRCRR